MTNSPAVRVDAEQEAAEPTMTDKIFRTVASQFGKPRGTLGRLAGRVMSLRTSNVRRSRWAVEQLRVDPDHRVLEIGFGPGLAVEALAGLVPDGSVWGVDHSALMVRSASRRNSAAIAEGRVHLFEAGVESLPSLAGPFDRVLAVNNVQFWPDPVSQLRALSELVDPLGQIALVSQPRGRGADAEASRRTGEGLRDMLVQAGFEVLREPTLDLEPPVVALIARPASGD